MADLDTYGGDRGRNFGGTGFFRVHRAPDRWWFADPDGNGWLTIGIAHAEDSDLKYPHNVDVWKTKLFETLKSRLEFES